MKIYTLETQVTLQVSLKEAWDFFSDPGNLSIITPASMGFEITHQDGKRMYPGMIISYRVRPFGWIPVNWVTEITHVAQPHYFVDEQRFGPYRLWHHKHYFQETEHGLLCGDLVHYALPWGLMGRSMHPFLIRPRLEQIFDFRKKVLLETFGGS
ncbi:MAG TPA: cell division inhibitor [Leptospiraceae bacterium]|nr:cell division inhibitor [Spirochaetaceae bacterium]HBS06191.1 cell division inhibitor [Leptospiraceae bacterium]|tara:strand:+ start:280492 stop:280953 length:462 start_codon:yes stop_codon:yes gene_type:complete